MSTLNRHNLASTRLLAGVALTAFLGVALLAPLSGCKNNTTSAAYPGRTIAPPPQITAFPAPDGLETDDILMSPAWQTAQWHEFSAPSNTTDTTAPTKAAILFDAKTLYVAFISHQQPIARTPGDVTRDAVSLYLDTEGDDRNMIQIAVDSTGKASATWIRNAVPARPLADGTPDFGHPVTANPDVFIKGLTTKVGENLAGASPTWTAVLAVPLQMLPLPLRATAAPGTHWKFNLTRTIVTTRNGRRVEELQSNLSPFHINAQAISPYRLATLILAPDPAAPTQTQNPTPQ